jgi:Arc/MetJ-type ribon-helix-helix transcriptional regulator
MTQAISVRLDEDAVRALLELEATGMSRSEAVRRALVDSATRMRDKHALAAEVAALDKDEDDRVEMLAVATLMENLRAPG